MSLANNYPSVRPSLLLDFARSKRLDPRITFTRASTGTYYDGETEAKAEENLLLQSQTFETPWSGAGASVTSNTTTAPDGTTTAGTLTEDSSTSFHITNQAVVGSGTTTLSVFAKLGAGSRFLTIGFSRSINDHGSATFDLSAGTNTQTQANGTYSSATATIAAVAQGFYRCTLTILADTVTNVRIGLNNTGTPATNNRGFGASYTGDGTSSIILWGAQLEQRSFVTAYTPTTTARITNYIPVLLTSQNNVPRFDHDPTTNASLGLLIEEERTNLLTYSSEFGNTAWIRSNTIITDNTIVAPDGTLTGDKLIENTANNLHIIRTSSISVVIGARLTYTVYAKQGERRYFIARINDTSSNANASSLVADLQTGTIIGAPTSYGGFSNTTGSITPVGNGWFRVSLTCTPSVSLVFWKLDFTNDGTVQPDGQGISYTGDGYSGIYIWGAQLEAGAFPTSYIPTVAAQATRGSDLATMTGPNFSSWFNNNEGTVYANYRLNSQATSRSIYQINAGTSVSNHIGLRYAASGSIQFVVFVNNINQVNFVVSDINTNGSSYKIANAYTRNNFNQAVDGLLPSADNTSGILPTVDRLRIGCEGGVSTAAFLCGTIAKLAYYPYRLSNAQLQALTGS